MALCTVCVFAQTTGEPTTAEEYLNCAVEYDNSGDYIRAIADYTQAIKLDPNLRKAYEYRGSCYASLGEFDKGIEDLTKIINDRPYTLGYIRRGRIYIQKGENNKAIEDFTNVITSKYPTMQARGYDGRSLAYYKMKNYINAIADATKAIELNKNSINAYDTRACAYLEQNNKSAALADYKQIVTLTANAENYSDDTIAQNFAGISTPGIPVVAGAAVYMEMQVGKFLGQDTSRYQSMLQYITDRGNVTQGEIEGFVREGIVAVVDAEFNKVMFLLEGSPNDSYNITLTKTADNKYTVRYEGFFNGVNKAKEVTVTSLEALPSADFTSANISDISTRANIIPAIVYAEWKQKGYTDGIDALDLVKSTLINFYTTPNTTTYSVLTGIYARYWKGSFSLGSFSNNARTSFYLSVYFLSSPLAIKMSEDVNINYVNLAKSPSDPRYNVFSRPYTGN
jgi:tetratricopeptide (TPR) repeat protein